MKSKENPTKHNKGIIKTKVENNEMASLKQERKIGEAKN